MSLQAVTQQHMLQSLNADSPHANDQRRSRAKAHCAEVVNQVFERLKTIFPAWTRALPNVTAEQQAKRQWTLAFYEAGIRTEQQVNLGLRVARQQQTDWWPSPGKFIRWCRPDPEHFGLPTEERAFRMACRQFIDDELPAAVTVARENCDPYTWLRLPEAKARQLFSYHYGVVVRRVMQGEDLTPDVPAALPEKPEARPCDPDVAKQHIAHLKAMLRRAAA